jgi:hypothetical protein
MRSAASLTAALALGFSTLAASAMPIDPGPATETGLVTKVIQGCGPNGFRGPGGHCRPRYSCPAGWHPGPDGFHCFPNGWRRYW